MIFTEEDLKHIEELKTRYEDKQSVLLPVLWMVQDKFGWISEENMKEVASLLQLPEKHVFGVVTFYTMFNKVPKGKYNLQVCTNVSCMLRGGFELYKYISDKLGLKNKQTTEDGMFTLEDVECLGSCGTAPMMQVNNGEYYENLTKEKVDELLEHFRKNVKEK
jgi:NADH-quinone oxidoreductase E subunit